MQRHAIFVTTAPTVPAGPVVYEIHGCMQCLPTLGETLVMSTNRASPSSSSPNLRLRLASTSGIAYTPMKVPCQVGGLGGLGG